MTEQPDLEVVNRTLGEVVRKQEQQIIDLRQAILLSIGTLRIAGYHTLSDKMYELWQETAS